MKTFIKKNKINGRTIGIFLAITLIIPSNYGLDFFGINFEDVPLVILFVFLFFKKVQQNAFLKFDKLMLTLLFSFFLYTNIFTKNLLFFNQTNLRFYFYFFLTYLCIDTIRNTQFIILEIFTPLSIVMIANFVVIVFQVQLPGTIDGWISNNSGSSNILTSGRLGGFQGGGPNVIGIICAVYVLICVYKISIDKDILQGIVKNKITAVLLIISFLNLYLTYSRGSYLALLVGLLVLLFFTRIINKSTKFIILIFGILTSLTLVFIYPSIFLKQSNRSFLNNLAISNIELFIGTGGGSYIKEVYKEYLVTLDEDELLDRFNFTYSDDTRKLFTQNDIAVENEDAEGYLKLNFDYKDGLLPRSVVTFYHSINGIDWHQIGSDHTSGLVIDLIVNDSYFEVGGWGDGQSPGESYLDGFVSEVNINTLDETFKYVLNEENRDIEYFIYLPKSTEYYDNRNDGKIIFSEDGLKLKRPRSYWIAIPNESNLSQKDFEIVLKLKVNNIPKGNETLFSQSSIMNSSEFINNQSWKWSIVDGRMYFFWIGDVVSGYSNFVGGQSLRSGKLISTDGNFNSVTSNFSLSQYDEITTSHNGFLTMSVEYGLFPISLIVLGIIFIIYKNFNYRNHLEIALLLMLLTQNLTNDLVYSPDIAIYFWMIPVFFILNLTKD